jgi:glycine cleavage system regulatory protein
VAVATFVLSVLGDDQPGLVSSLSSVVTEHGGSWERSQLSRLAGKFAGIVVVTAPSASAPALLTALTSLPGLTVVVERTDVPPPSPSVHYLLTLLGDDRPGIVAEISAALAARMVSIEELATDVREAPMAGGLLFDARAVLSAPSSESVDSLRGALEGVADELMVELTPAE